MTTAYVAMWQGGHKELPLLQTIANTISGCRFLMDYHRHPLNFDYTRIAHVEIREIPAPDEETRKAMEE